MKNTQSESQGTVGKVERYAALGYGCLTHVSFVFAVGVMIYALFGGLQFGYGSCKGLWRWISNALLIVQFPVFHSLLLARAGGPMLDRLAPRKLALQLRPTTYVMVASFQLLLVFLLWSPEGRVLWIPTGFVYYAHCAF